MDDECRFAGGGCLTHADTAGSDRVLWGHAPALCTHAAAALQATMEELTQARDDYMLGALKHWQRIQELEARVRELEGLYIGVSNLCRDAQSRCERAEATVGRLREGLEKAADTFADFHRSLGLLRHPIAAEAARMAEEATRAALSPQEPPPSA